MMDNKQEAVSKLDLEYFKNHYWLKSDLIALCRKFDLSTQGAKQDLVNRIETFLTTGIKANPLSNKISPIKDSNTLITRNTPVVNYKNDAATRQFFVAHIGKHFRFNAYLRQFTQQNNIINLTYGDLVDGWLAYELNKKKSSQPNSIGKQFEFNQFTRDFFINGKGKSRADAIKAWQLVKSVPGPKTYQHYKTLHR